MAWCFEDEASSWSDGLLERLRQGDEITVPAHWPAEILNALLVAERRQRIKAGQADQFGDLLSRLPSEIEPPLSSSRGKAVSALAEKHGLTVYDAAYLELVQRRQVPFATLDSDVRKAAQIERVVLL